MGEKKLREWLSYEEFRDEIRNWSYDTFIRRIKHDGFPASKDGGKWVVNRKKAELWFKVREAQF